MVLHLPKTRTATDALRAEVGARQKRKSAEQDPTSYRLLYQAEAQEGEDYARKILNLEKVPRVVTGGELNGLFNGENPEFNYVDTIKEPDAVTLGASRERMDLAAESNALTLAADAAETIQARNSLEKMLAHQMATAHHTSMRILALVNRDLPGEQFNRRVDPVVISRLANAAARLLDTYQRGLLTLHRVRTGGQQTVVVQHVNLGEGAQAMVAGNINHRSEIRG